MALGRVYENYLQVVVRGDSPSHTLTDLAGHPVSVGVPGAGASFTGHRLLAAADVQVAEQHLPLHDAIDALARGTLAALIWSGGVPTPPLAAVRGSGGIPGIRLFPTGGLLPRLRQLSDAQYDEVTVPAAAAVVRTLAVHPEQLVPPEARGTQYLDLRTLVATGHVHLHAAAAAEYRRLHG